MAAARTRRGRLDPPGHRPVEPDGAFDDEDETSPAVAGPEILDPTFDEFADLASFCGDQSDGVRRHVRAYHRHQEEDLW